MTKIKQKQLFDGYKNLVEEIEQQAGKLWDMHKQHMQCRKGCSFCCIDFSILPIEFYYILNNLKKKNFRIETETNSENNICAFLKDNTCSIYQHRPIMCRTHGFPLLYTNDEGEFELSACELNFTKFDFDEFTQENTLQQDKYNSKLFLMNRDFIAAFQDEKYNEFDLIPIKKLAEHLNQNNQ